MAFNKEEYWKRRKDGKRGQGDKPAKVTGIVHPGGGTYYRKTRIVKEKING